MHGPNLQFFDVGEGQLRRRIAYLKHHSPSSDRCGLMWLAGFKSDMSSTKATALANYAQTLGTDFVRFDYSGHGLSEGVFEQGTVGAWLEEAIAVFTHLTQGPQVIIGSSMGGYLALLLLRHLQKTKAPEAARISSLVLLAPAWDMTEELMWKKFSSEQKKNLLIKGSMMQPSEYEEPYVITQNLIEDGRKHLLGPHPFNPGRPVWILQGLKDTAVPYDHVEKLKTVLQGDWIHLLTVEDGEHRLSRSQDLKKLFQILDEASLCPRLKKN